MLQKNWESKICERLRKLCADEPKQRSCQVIIELSGKETGEIITLINKHQGKILRGLNILPGVVAEVPLPMIETLAKSDQVKKIWTDHQVGVM